MKKLHFTRTIGFLIMVLAVFGLYTIFLAISDMGTTTDSHLLARIGVPGLGVILVAAVALTIFSEVSLIKHWNDARK